MRVVQLSSEVIVDLKPVSGLHDLECLPDKPPEVLPQGAQLTV